MPQPRKQTARLRSAAPGSPSSKGVRISVEPAAPAATALDAKPDQLPSTSSQSARAGSTLRSIQQRRAASTAGASRGRAPIGEAGRLQTGSIANEYPTRESPLVEAAA